MKPGKPSPYILQVLRYLACQGLSLRGSSLTHETDGNCMQLLLLFCMFDEGLPSWLKKKTDKYTSGDMQNELLQVMANRILREIAASIRGRPFVIMVDETTGVSTQEQCVIVLR